MKLARTELEVEVHKRGTGLGVQFTDTISNNAEPLVLFSEHLIVTIGEELGRKVEKGLSRYHGGGRFFLEGHVCIVLGLVAVLGQRMLVEIV